MDRADFESEWLAMFVIDRPTTGCQVQQEEESKTKRTEGGAKQQAPTIQVGESRSGTHSTRVSPVGGQWHCMALEMERLVAATDPDKLHRTSAKSTRVLNGVRMQWQSGTLTWK